MMDKKSFQAAYGSTDTSMEYELTEHWLNINVQPDMVKNYENHELDFIVDTEVINPSVIRKILTDKGYGVLWWVHRQEGALVKEMKIKVLW